MAPSIKLVIFQFFCFFVVHECKLNELYRWKQISFEKLEAGENIPKTIPIPMLTDPSVNFDYWMFTKIPVRRHIIFNYFCLLFRICIVIFELLLQVIQSNLAWDVISDSNLKILLSIGISQNNSISQFENSFSFGGECGILY